MAKTPTKEKPNAKNKGPHVLMRSTLMLPVPLNDEEMRHRGTATGIKAQELSDLELDFESQKEDYKGRKKALERDLALLHETLKSGNEVRDVPVETVVEESVHPTATEKWRAVTRRLDTNEVVGSRPLTPEEHQTEFFRRGEKNPGGKSAGASADDQARPTDDEPEAATE